MIGQPTTKGEVSQQTNKQKPKFLPFQSNNNNNNNNNKMKLNLTPNY